VISYNARNIQTIPREGDKERNLALLSENLFCWHTLPNLLLDQVATQRGERFPVFKIFSEA